MISDKPIPNKEAAELIRGKSVVSREVFAGMAPELRARAFTITGIEDMDLVQSIRDRIAGLPEGGDWFEIRDSIASDLLKEWGDPDVSRRRATLLLRQHSFQAYQATRWRVMKRNTSAFPYWQYIAFGDSRVRPAHEALDGLVLPQDHPFWLDHYPPWDWGCRCMVRAISPEERERLLDEDAERDPADRRVLTDEEIARMRETGQITRSQGTVDVRSPRKKMEDKGEDPQAAFGWTPGDLGIPMDNIEERWDPEVIKAFWDSADAEVFDGDRSVGDWLREGLSAPKAGLDVSQGRDVSRPYGRFKVPAAQAKVLEANKRQDISDDLERLPPDIFGDGAMPAFRFEPGVAAYFPRSNSIRLNKNPKAYHGSIGSARHEVGHGVHYNKGILTDDFVADSFKAAADQDLALLKSSGVYTKLLGHPMATQGRELIDHVGLNLDDPELSEKMGGIFDTVGGLTKGKIGMGHTKKYYREKNNGLMEAFANAFEAVLSNDDLYKKQFPNLAHYMEELIQ